MKSKPALPGFGLARSQSMSTVIYKGCTRCTGHKHMGMGKREEENEFLIYLPRENAFKNVPQRTEICQ